MKPGGRTTPALLLAAMAAVLLVRESEIMSMAALLAATLIGMALVVSEYAERENEREEGEEMETFEKMEMTERIIQATAALTPYSPERLWENWSLLAAANGYDYSATLRDFLASSFLRP